MKRFMMGGTLAVCLGLWQHAGSAQQQPGQQQSVGQQSGQQAVQQQPGEPGQQGVPQQRPGAQRPGPGAQGQMPPEQRQILEVWQQIGQIQQQIVQAQLGADQAGAAAGNQQQNLSGPAGVNQAGQAGIPPAMLEQVWSQIGAMHSRFVFAVVQSQRMQAQQQQSLPPQNQAATPQPGVENVDRLYAQMMQLHRRVTQLEVQLALKIASQEGGPGQRRLPERAQQQRPQQQR